MTAKKPALLFVGPVQTQSGYGVHARQLLRALVDCGDFDVSVEPIRWGETPTLTDETVTWIAPLIKPCPNPQVCVQVTIPNEFKRRAPLTVGVTAGIEVDRVSPQWLAKCNAEVDFVVVPSEHSRTAFMVEYQTQDGKRLHLERPLFVVPEGVDTSVFKPPYIDPQAYDQFVPNSPLLDTLGVPSKNFVFCGLGLDKGLGQDRKNVGRLVENFCRAFSGRGDVGLVLKTSIVNGSSVDFGLVQERVRLIKDMTGCGEFPRVFVLHGRMTEGEMATLYRDERVVAAVSLTHGEGFGLPLIEAAACGTPVMVTDWSGHLDFLSRDGRKLFVPFAYDMVPIPPSAVWNGVMEQGTNWAEVKSADVQEKLQKMVVSSTTPRKWAAELAKNIASRYSLEATANTFITLLRQATSQLKSQPLTKEDALKALRDDVRSKGPCFVYTMPVSAGDVFLSTGVVASLRVKHPHHRAYLATSPTYFDIVKDLKHGDGPLVDEVIEWQPWMTNPELLESVFDLAYTPNLQVQHLGANWVHGGHGRNLIDEFAAQCNVKAERPVLPELDWKKSDVRGAVAVHVGGQKSARSYAHWVDVVRNLKSSGLKTVQVGSADDTDMKCDLDLRGKTGHRGLCEHLDSVSCFVGIDSYPMHVAAVVGTPVVVLFGSSYAHSTGPKDWKRSEHGDRDTLIGKKHPRRLTLLETPSRNGCEKACYRDACHVDVSNPCLNNIDPEAVFSAVCGHLGIEPTEWQAYRPNISGYTHILNPKKHAYPYLQSIESMLGFCSEVVVVDGGSTDGSVEELKEWAAERDLLNPGGVPYINLITREWDPEEPGMDGMQKAFGRAMCASDAEFLWQQDADEVVHEDDYAKIRDICKRFPTDVDLLHLPIMELWGDDQTVRTDRSAWKWRLSRNNLRVTHGINSKARVMDPKTGRIYAKSGMSDGCEMVDIVTGDHLPHRGFWTKELEELRLSDPEQYGRVMNEVFNKLPTVFHTSWANLPRKVRNFRDFWDRQWSVLHNETEPHPRFPDAVTEEDVQATADMLKHRGGEHGPAVTFKSTRTAPRSLASWFAKE